MDNLQPFAQQLLSRMDLIQVPGKRNKKVPISITPEVGTAMHLLVAKRDICGIPSDNKYYFATDSASCHFKTWLVLHNDASAIVSRNLASSRIAGTEYVVSHSCTGISFDNRFELLSINMMLASGIVIKENYATGLCT
jgi:hypothetical protein